MSHVIGQGNIASNHYRTSEYRASQYQPQPVAQPVAQSAEQFNSETVEFNATERSWVHSLGNLFKRGGKGKGDDAIKASIEKTIKNMEAVLPDARKNAQAGNLGDGAKKMFDNYDNEEILARLKNYFDAGGTPDAGDVQWLRTIWKGGDDLETLASNKDMWSKIAPSISGRRFDVGGLDKTKLGAAADSLQEGIQGASFSPRQKTLLKYTGGATVALAGFGMFIFGPGSDLINKWANYTTGLDCPDKAAGIGYDEGTPEYAEAVKTCQEATMASLMKLGYSALAIVGFVGLIAVTRAVPKRKAKKEDSEDEE